MSVARVSRVFARAGLELDARGLADALWLADHLPAARPRDAEEPVSTVDEGDGVPVEPVEPVPDPPDDDPVPDPDPAPDRAATVSPADPPQEDLLPLHLRPRQPGRPETNPAVPLLAHAAPAIPDTLRLMRSLRPLKRTVDSRHRTVLDEEATVRRIAERRIWLPVLQPAREPWLDLVLVADLGAGGQLWGRLAHELYGVFRRLGAFRDVRLRHLHADSEGRSWVTTSGRGAGSAPRSPSELIDPTGRRLILLLTDGIGAAWRSGHLGAVVHRWGGSGPVAILQPLPAHLWERTALRPSPGRLGTPSPGAPNNRLSFVSYRRRQHGPDLPVPVLEIDPGWLAPWARLAGGTAHGGVDASVIFPGDAARGTPADRREPHDAVERVRAFRAEATPEAYELLTYLSAAPLSLPLMRTVQATMMPRSSPAHLAEILFSGLVATVDDGPAADDRYEFVDGVRDVLLGTLQRHEAERVDQEVSAFIERWLRLPGAGLAAAVPTPSGALDLPAESRPFARIRAEILDRITGVSAPAASTVPTDDGVAGEGAAAESDDPEVDPARSGVSGGEPGAPSGIPGEPVVGEVLNAHGQIVGSGFMVSPRYLATCAHVVNTALGKSPTSQMWPSDQVSVLIGRRRGGYVRTAVIAAWPAHQSTFDQLDVTILRVEGEALAEVPSAVLFGAPEADEMAHILSSSSRMSGRITAVASGGLAHLHLSADTGDEVLQPMSGAPVWRPSTGEIVGMVNGRPALSGSRGEIAVLPAAVVRQVVVDYLVRPQPAKAEPSDDTTQGRHARPTATPTSARVVSGFFRGAAIGKDGEFHPLNEVERHLWNAIRVSVEEAVKVLSSAPLWAPAGPSTGSATELIAALRSRRDGVIDEIVLVTAPQRFSERPSGPWPFREVASVWPSSATMVVNPGTPIRLALTAYEIRALVAPTGEPTVDLATSTETNEPTVDLTTSTETSEPTVDLATSTETGPPTLDLTTPRSTARGQRFPRQRLRRGYDPDEVDAFAERIDDTLFHYQHGGARAGAPLTAQEVHDVVFRVRFNGYDEWQVDLWLDRVRRAIAEAER
ncbi:DivIVA domain-containing protein [Micromonospora humi]|uniref:DivIVA domain-containing protein n=1 Tax=Micromonospora humi TaxID=745366 RepID=A0A1C5GSQ5_9ACTN|nr:DivIVA domain-containing protein [Micromonospora humi]